MHFMTNTQYLPDSTLDPTNKQFLHQTWVDSLTNTLVQQFHQGRANSVVVTSVHYLDCQYVQGSRVVVMIIVSHIQSINPYLTSWPPSGRSATLGSNSISTITLTKSCST